MQLKQSAPKKCYRIGMSLGALAAAACLWPAIAAAQPPDPTASDGNGNTAAGSNALFNVTNVQRHIYILMCVKKILKDQHETYNNLWSED